MNTELQEVEKEIEVLTAQLEAERAEQRTLQAQLRPLRRAVTQPLKPGPGHSTAAPRPPPSRR